MVIRPDGAIPSLTNGPNCSIKQFNEQTLQRHTSLRPRPPRAQEPRPGHSEALPRSASVSGARTLCSFHTSAARVIDMSRSFSLTLPCPFQHEFTVSQSEPHPIDAQSNPSISCNPFCAPVRTPSRSRPQAIAPAPPRETSGEGVIRIIRGGEISASQYHLRAAGSVWRRREADDVSSSGGGSIRTAFHKRRRGSLEHYNRLTCRSLEAAFADNNVS